MSNTTVLTSPESSTPAGACVEEEQTDKATRATSTVARRHPRIRVNLPADGTVGDVRIALRRLAASDRIADVVLHNQYGAVSLTEIDEIEIVIEMSA